MKAQAYYIRKLDIILNKLNKMLAPPTRTGLMHIVNYMQQSELDLLINLQSDLAILLNPRKPVEITDQMFDMYSSRAATILANTAQRVKHIKSALEKEPTITPIEFKANRVWRQSLYTRSSSKEFNYNVDSIIASDNSYKDKLEPLKLRYKKSLATYEYVNNIQGPLPADYDRNNKKHYMWFVASTSIYDRLIKNIGKLKDGEQLGEKFTVSMSYQDLWDLINTQDWKCAFTHIPFHEGKTSLDNGRLSGLKSSPDRIDPSKGYHKGNVEFVLVRMNMMKWTTSYSEFISLCSDIANYSITRYNIKLLDVNQIISALDQPINPDSDLTL